MLFELKKIKSFSAKNIHYSLGTHLSSQNIKIASIYVIYFCAKKKVSILMLHR